MKNKINLFPERLLFYGAICLFIFCLFLFFSSCSVSRNTEKHTETTKVSESENSQTNTAVNTVIHQKTTTDIDTCIKVPESNVSASAPVSHLNDGDTLTTTNDNLSAMVFIDKKGIVQLRASQVAKTLPIKGKKVVETSATVSVAQSEQKTVQKETTSEKKEISRKTKVNNYSWLLLLLIIPVAAIIYRFRKQIPYLNTLCK